MGGSQGGLAGQVVALINAERVAAGLPELSTSSALNNAAQTRAEEITRHFAHERPDGAGWATVLDDYDLKRSAWGENIAMGRRTAEAVMDDWMASQGHRDNILRSSFTQVGVGVAQDDNGQTFWVQLFIG